MKKILLAAVLSCCVIFTSCQMLGSIANQLQGLANLANCTYQLKNVSSLSIAGVNVKNITNGNITVADGAKLAAAIISKKVPLTMDININVTNPTQNVASLSTMDYILEIDGVQMAAGSSNQPHTINAGTTTSVPLSIGTDIYSLFKTDGASALTNFVKSFSSDGTSSKVAIKIKPSLNVGGATIPSPNYITLEKNTGNNSGSNSGNNSGNNNGGLLSNGR